MEMYNPAHPGKIVRECMGDAITVSALAKHLGMTRANLSMILNGRMRISASVAVKLGEAFPNQNAELWMALQSQHDLWHAKRRKRTKIQPLAKPYRLQKAA
jgi:addiction module HigA family antidote